MITGGSLSFSVAFDKTSVFFQVFSLPPNEKQQPYMHVTTRILGNPSKPRGVFKGIVKEYYSYTCLVVGKS